MSLQDKYYHDIYRDLPKDPICNMGRERHHWLLRPFTSSSVLDFDTCISEYTQSVLQLLSWNSQSAWQVLHDHASWNRCFGAWCICWHSGLAPPFEAHSLGWKERHLQWGVSGLLRWTGRIGGTMPFPAPAKTNMFFNTVIISFFFRFQKQQFARPIKPADFFSLFACF